MCNSRKLLSVFIPLILLALVVTNASAVDRVWFVRTVESEPYHPVCDGRNALLMRSNGTWPVVAYGGPQPGISMMGATGWQSAPLYNDDSPSVDAATSDSGRVGFAWSDGTVKILDRNGWSTTNFGSQNQSQISQRASLAFNSQDMPTVAHNGGHVNPSVGAYYENCLTLASYSGYGWYQDVVKNKVLLNNLWVFYPWGSAPNPAI